MRYIYRYQLTALLLLFAGTAISQTAFSGTQVISLDGQAFSFDTQKGNDKKVKVEDLKSKEVSQEIAMPKGGEVYLELNSRSVQVKTWDQPKIKVVATALYEGENKLTDEQWIEKLGLSLKALGTSVKIKAGNQSNFYVSFGEGTYAATRRLDESQSAVTVFGTGTVTSGNKMGSSSRKIITVYMPANTSIDVECKYGEVKLPANVGDVLVDVSNGSFEAEDLGKLRLRSKYSNANIGNVKEAEVEFANGRFTAKDIDDLDIESKYATIEMASAKKIKLVSSNDEFEVEDVVEIRGRKNYGNLRITRLSASIELEGNNADVKIRKVGPNVKYIKFENRYADIRIPLREFKNYAIDFTGPYSTVYGDFEKVEQEYDPSKDKTVSTGAIRATTIPSNTDNNNPPMAVAKGTLSGVSTLSRITSGFRYGGANTPAKFLAKVGDGNGLKVDIKCQNCTVDFK